MAYCWQCGGDHETTTGGCPAVPISAMPGPAVTVNGLPVDTWRLVTAIDSLKLAVSELGSEVRKLRYEVQGPSPKIDWKAVGRSGGPYD